MKQKIIFILINVIVTSILFISYYRNKSEIEIMRYEFLGLSNDLKSLHMEYMDSTKAIRPFMGTVELYEYVEKVDDGDIRDFVLSQGRQWEYFEGLNTKIHNQLANLEIQLEYRDRYFQIGTFVSIGLLAINIFLSFLLIQKKGSEKG